MRGITLICVGKLKEKYLFDAQSEYVKRISSFFSVEIKELAEERLPANPSEAEIKLALKKEADAIRLAVPAGFAAAAMCIQGRELSSEEFSELLTSKDKGHIAFIIGGSFGLDETLVREADYRLSLSKMTFPHHLARVLLLEQIYRGFMIDTGGKYHK